MHGSRDRYDDIESGGLTHRMLQAFMQHPLRVLISKVWLPVGLILGGMIAVNLYVLSDVDGTYNGVAKGLGRVQLFLEREGDSSLTGKMSADGEQFDVTTGRAGDGKVELAFALAGSGPNSSLNQPIFVGAANWDTMSGVLTRGSKEYEVTLKRSPISSFFQRLVSWK